MTENTDKSINESLSAFIDGECSESELSALLDAIEGQSEHIDSYSANQSDYSQTQFSAPESMRETLKRYHLAQAALHKDIKVDPSVDLSLSIAAAIDKEDAPAITNVAGEWTRWKSWRDWAGKTAIAASVAFGFVAGAQFLKPSMTDSGTLMADEAGSSSQMSGANVPQGFELPPLSARTVSAGQSSGQASPVSSPVKVTSPKALPAGTIVIRNSEVSSKVNRMIFKHAEQSASSGAFGVIPYARVSDVEPAEENTDSVDAEGRQNTESVE